MRYTETKLDKLIRIHHGMVDNIVNQACVDLEAIKPEPVEEVKAPLFGLAALVDTQPFGSLSYGAGMQAQLGMGGLGLMGGGAAAQGRLGSAFGGIIGGI